MEGCSAEEPERVAMIDDVCLLEIEQEQNVEPDS